ncbi:hypothetical protein JCM10207_003989 [Rhodosporidiobolus poonsookiae]
MRFAAALSALALASSALAAPAPASLVERDLVDRNVVVKPRVMIISMFTPEREVWLEPLHLDVDYPLVGASPLYPNVSCDRRRLTCIVTTGEAEINAASTIMALTLSSQFDLTETYFLIAGIAGMNPHRGTLGTAAWARFAIQVGLAYEIDAREMPSNWTTGYWALGTDAPGKLPAVADLYGTEVFELNTNLLDRALNLTSGLTLNDSSTAAETRQKYGFAPANEVPKITQCDAMTSDGYWHGELLAQTWTNYSSLMTNGEAVACMTAQEDNATLESMVRAHKAGLVDYSRILLLRTASNFDRAPPGGSEYEDLQSTSGGFSPAIANLVVAGKPVVDDIVHNWDSIYSAGIAPQASLNGSYYGDNLGTIREGAAMARRARRSFITAKIPSSV